LDFGPVDYTSTVPPKGYECSVCAAHGVKLWREYQTCADYTSLFCLVCAQADQKKTGYRGTEDGKSLYTGVIKHWYQDDETHWTANGAQQWWLGWSGEPDKRPTGPNIRFKSDEERHDSIGWLTPAVPTPEGDTYWGRCSTPDDACAWWYALPYSPTNQEAKP